MFIAIVGAVSALLCLCLCVSVSFVVWRRVQSSRVVSPAGVRVPQLDGQDSEKDAELEPLKSLPLSPKTPGNERDSEDELYEEPSPNAGHRTAGQSVDARSRGHTFNNKLVDAVANNEVMLDKVVLQMAAVEEAQGLEDDEDEYEDEEKQSLGERHRAISTDLVRAQVQDESMDDDDDDMLYTDSSNTKGFIG